MPWFARTGTQGGGRAPTLRLRSSWCSCTGYWGAVYAHAVQGCVCVVPPRPAPLSCVHSVVRSYHRAPTPRDSFASYRRILPLRASRFRSSCRYRSASPLTVEYGSTSRLWTLARFDLREIKRQDGISASPLRVGTTDSEMKNTPPMAMRGQEQLFLRGENKSIHKI